jgi:hypothetical protein
LLCVCWIGYIYSYGDSFTSGGNNSLSRLGSSLFAQVCGDETRSGSSQGQTKSATQPACRPGDNGDPAKK